VLGGVLEEFKVGPWLADVLTFSDFQQLSLFEDGFLSLLVAHLYFSLAYADLAFLAFGSGCAEGSSPYACRCGGHVHLER